MLTSLRSDGLPIGCERLEKGAKLPGNSAAGYRAIRGQSFLSLQNVLPSGVALAQPPAAAAVDRAPRPIRETQPRTTNGTTWSGSTLAQSQNPASRPPRSTRRCCCRPLRGSGSGAEADLCRRPDGDSRPLANRGQTLPASRETGLFPEQRG